MNTSIYQKKKKATNLVLKYLDYLSPVEMASVIVLAAWSIKNCNIKSAWYLYVLKLVHEICLVQIYKNV